MSEYYENFKYILKLFSEGEINNNNKQDTLFYLMKKYLEENVLNDCDNSGDIGSDYEDSDIDSDDETIIDSAIEIELNENEDCKKFYVFGNDKIFHVEIINKKDIKNENKNKIYGIFKNVVALVYTVKEDDFFKNDLKL